jgi:D-sedoheptulose 7-phosphate isomerase
VNPITECRSYFELLSKTIQKLPFDQVEQVAEMLVNAYERQRTIFLFGNGGSAALASHFACDLGKGTVNGSKKRFRVMALTDNVPTMTAWANDSKYEDIFSEQLANFAGPEDVAFAISGSGNSPNVLKALRVAGQAGSTTIGLTGFAGGRMLALCDACVVVPCDNMQIIEDLHLCVAHSLFTCIRAKLGGEIPDTPIAFGPRLVTRTAAR